MNQLPDSDVGYNGVVDCYLAFVERVEMNEENAPLERVPPRLLFRSFLLVACAYILSHFFLIVSMAVLWWLLVPDAFAIATKENSEEFNRQFEQNPEKFLPNGMFWVLLVVNCVACFGIGFLVSWLAPFGKFPHAVFLAVILFVSFLQLTFSIPAEVRWMIVLLMGASPISVLLGANFFIRGRLADS